VKFPCHSVCVLDAAAALFVACSCPSPLSLCAKHISLRAAALRHCPLAHNPSLELTLVAAVVAPPLIQSLGGVAFALCPAGAHALRIVGRLAPCCSVYAPHQLRLVHVHGFGSEGSAVVPWSAAMTLDLLDLTLKGLNQSLSSWPWPLEYL